MGGNAYASMQHRSADKLLYIQSPIRRSPARMDCGVFGFRQSLSIFAVNLPEKISYCCFGAPVLCTGALFCTLFLIRKRLRPYRCAAHPLISIFAINSNIEIGGNYYEEINLRDYYPYYTQDMIVEVPDEVALLLREYMLLEEAYRIRTYRYKAFYSLDRDEGIEREILQKPLNPAEIWNSAK